MRWRGPAAHTLLAASTSALYSEAEAALMSIGVEEFFTEACPAARGLRASWFPRCESEQEVRRRGVVLRRWLTRKTLV